MPRDPRTYITVHDGMPEHPKVEALSDAAFRLLMESWCWCSRQLTDGRIKAGVWNRRSTPEARQELVDANLVEVTPDGVVMHDYTEHQRTAAEVAEMREKRAEAGRRGGLAKASKRVASAKGFAKQSAKQKASKPLAESETETEIELLRSSRETRADARTPTRGQRLPDGWKPDRATIDRLAAEYPHIDQRAEFDKFHDYWIAQPGQRGTKSDWTATWRNWIRRAAEQTQPRPSRQQEQSDDFLTRAMARAVEADRAQGELTA